MEYLFAATACIVFPLIIGYIYGRKQEPPKIDPDLYYTKETE